MKLEILTGRAKGWTAAACTDPGLRRTQNEDALLFLPGSGRFAVIDGMGGESGGEVAAAIAKDALAKQADPVEGLRLANEAILERARTEPCLLGMGCVATAIVLERQRLRMAHVGDSRLWLTSDDGSQQLTRDHTSVEEARTRALADGQTSSPATRHAVTRDLGGQRRAGSDWIDQLELELHGGELLVLASDGLHDVVTEAELFSTLRQAREHNEPPEALVRRLVELALTRGGPDNVSVLAVRIHANRPDPRPPSPRRWPLIVGVSVVLSAALGGLAGRASAPRAVSAPQAQVSPAPVTFQAPDFDLAQCPCSWSLNLEPGSSFSLNRSVSTSTRIRVQIDAIEQVPTHLPATSSEKPQ